MHGIAHRTDNPSPEKQSNCFVSVHRVDAPGCVRWGKQNVKFGAIRMPGIPVKTKQETQGTGFWAAHRRKDVRMTSRDAK